jgi:uncharacterized protein YdeI (YjbR/CyaY-like superfamily)
MGGKGRLPAKPEIRPRFFATPAAFRRWLAKNHASATELWVGFHKKGTGRRSMTWPQSVDQALCFGWIDGLRKSVDEDSYMIRFTPRTSGSIWSAINIGRAQALTEEGLMQPAGSRAFLARDDAKSRRYSFEQENVAFDDAQTKLFRANREAWTFFAAQPPSYRRTATWWVVSARQAATRERRLATLIADSEAGLRIKELRR